MVTVEEEYYLRSSLLLLKGCGYIALKVLRRVEQEEIQNSGKNIDVILREKEQKLKHKFSSNKQREKLFPENGPTNPETWDLAMIASVLLSCFRKSLNDNEIDAIKSISYKRNGVHAHSHSASLPRNTYEEVCKQLKQDISVLSSKFDQAVSTNCNNIISDCLKGKLDITNEKDAVKLVADSDDLFQKILNDIEKIEERIANIEPGKFKQFYFLRIVYCLFIKNDTCLK